jgi:hypothetical protein
MMCTLSFACSRVHTTDVACLLSNTWLQKGHRKLFHRVVFPLSLRLENTVCAAHSFLVSCTYVFFVFWFFRRDTQWILNVITNSLLLLYILEGMVNPLHVTNDYQAKTKHRSMFAYSLIFVCFLKVVRTLGITLRM